MEKKSRKSASKWLEAGERVLIAIWGDKMGELRGCRKNSHILAEMAAEMQKQGFKYTSEEVKTKMHNLTTRYRKEKQQVGTTGGSPSEWNLYLEMQSLLTPYKSYHAENLVQDNINDINSILYVPSPLPSSSYEHQAAVVASPLPSQSMLEDCPQSSTSNSVISPLPSSSSSTKSKRKDQLNNIVKKLEESTEKIFEEMKSTSQKIIDIEEEKKNILKEYVDREAEVQKALVEFLKRQ